MNNIDMVDMDILKEEAFAAEVAIADFEGLVGDTIYTHDAGDRETALRWMTMEETFYSRQCVEHWVFNRGFLFTSHGKAVVEELMDVVTFEEFDMSKIKNYMMDIEEFCDGYFYGGDSEFTVDEVAADADKFFRSTMAGDYARKYLETQLGEF